MTCTSSALVFVFNVFQLHEIMQKVIYIAFNFSNSRGFSFTLMALCPELPLLLGLYPNSLGENKKGVWKWGDFNRLISFNCVLCKLLAKDIVLDKPKKLLVQEQHLVSTFCAEGNSKLVSCLCHIQTPPLHFLPWGSIVHLHLKASTNTGCVRQPHNNTQRNNAAPA